MSNPIQVLDFEQPIVDLEGKIQALQQVSLSTEALPINIQEEVSRLKIKKKTLIEQIFATLTPWQITQLARHQLRPHTKDYIEMIFTDYDPLHGDRMYADDKALIGGVARLEGQPVVVLGHQKGRTTQEKVSCHFGMPHPEGYRKALRLMQLAERFKLPVITLIDTTGAYPGVGAESRNQSAAIAENLAAMSDLNTPIVSVVIGEGSSGGALGIGVSDHVAILEYGYYATISPEGCASILLKDATRAPEMADIMQITPKRLLDLKIVDEIIPEPLGGAHRDQAAMGRAIQSHLISTLSTLKAKPMDTLLAARYDRLMAYGR